ncbi:MAG: amino acid ABC transporter substrate-binding protein [Actinobacteria bacterium]|nr:amino acid ABC transporter substrate-binding protein [Thermoleophilia bacterium]MCB9010291.1 amino acid ABC transporter substrate-binding protein [Actinomycetota bacterium]
MSALAVVATAATLVACGSDDETAATTASASCAKENLALVSSGTLTIGTDKPAYPPWFVDDDPSNGKGYESAVAYAVAEQMGFTNAEVKWVVVPFNTAISPAKKKFDFDINQVSISDERRQAVDFSSGYYDVRQAVVTYKGSAIDGVTTVDGLKDAKLGAQVGTTSYTAIVDQIAPGKDPAVFDTNDLAVQALKNEQIDGIVVDVPTAFYMAAAQLDNGVIVGQLPGVGDAPEQFGLVLDKDSALTGCVSEAVDALRADGTLESLQSEWLANQGAPELQ